METETVELHVRIKNNLKNYGDDKELWYYDYQGETFPLNLDTKKGYLVKHEHEGELKLYMVKKKHGEFVEVIVDDSAGETPDDDMV